MEQKKIKIQSNGSERKRVLVDTSDLDGWLQELSTEDDLEADERKKTEDTSSTVAELINTKKFDDAFSAIEEISAQFRENEAEGENEICSPVKIRDTWTGHDEVLKQRPRDTCAKIRQRIETQPDGNRTPRVVGIRLGSGCGKSHLLLEAPKILNHHGIYITFNLEQDLRYDLSHTDQALSLRIVLRLARLPNRAFAGFIDSEIGYPLLSLQPKVLREFAVHQLGKINSSVFIGVDEIMELKNIGTVQRIASLAGEIAAQCFRDNKHQLVSFFITSLRLAAFSTSGGRAVLILDTPIVDESAVELVLHEYLKGRDMEKCKALVISAAGFHFRSMVFAARAIAKDKDMDPKVQSVLVEVFKRWRERIAQFEALCGSVRAYVKDYCKGIEKESQPESRVGMVEEFTDRSGALPPPLICAAFGVIADDETGIGGFAIDRNHPLFGLFNCEFAFTDPAKHLEQFGTFYDIFRSSIKLPVLPSCQDVVVPEDSSKHDGSWFQKLKYPANLTISTESILTMRERKPILTEEGKNLSTGKYYAPSALNHPLIDRAFVAFRGKDKAVVLIQDKLNKDVPKAVKDLNIAAGLIREHHKDMEVLCIVNVIGAGCTTTAQNALLHPYTLVRERELDAFYSVNFSGVARFARRRKELASVQESQHSG